MNISHVGIGTGRGLPFSLAPAIRVAVHQQANFSGYNLLAKQTNIQGQADICQPGDNAVGVFVDCSPKGDSSTVETEGYEWVNYSGATPAVGDTVTVGANGTVTLIASGTGAKVITATLEECLQGLWTVDQVNSVTNQVLIDIEGL